jgi:hypothetical protein
MKIGTSLGKCVKSLLDGDVDYDDVLFIVSNTNGPDEARLRDIMTEYWFGYAGVDRTGRRSDPAYDLSGYTKEQVQEVAVQLFHDGKLFQPRMFIKGGWGNAHGLKDTWYDIMPTVGSSEAAKHAWDSYVMMSKLSQ